MAHPPAPPRGSPPPMVPPHGGPMGPPPHRGQQPMHPSMAAHYPHVAEPPVPQPEPPPEHTYPCGCAWPGTHKQDCMWSLWEQMRDNYLQTRELMGKFMTQANTMQETAREGVKCECPAGCHGTDLGKAMGLQQMTGVTVPWGTALGGPVGPAGSGGAPPQSYSVENEARKQMEEQKRIKNTWVRFLSIFDMALDMANDVSKDRWEQNRRRKERQRLEREQRLEEMRKERLERQKGSKPEPPPEKGEKATEQKEKDEKEKETEQQKEEKPKTPKETPNEEEQQKEEPVAEEEETPAGEPQTEEPNAEEEG